MGEGLLHCFSQIIARGVVSDRRPKELIQIDLVVQARDAVAIGGHILVRDALGAL